MNMETLLTLAQMAIAMAGFSSIVVTFKRRDNETWSRSDANRFHGMLIHTILASLFSYLPFLITEFVDSDNTAIKWCSGLLGFLTAGQIVIATKLESSSNIWIKGQLVLLGSVIMILLVLNALSFFSETTVGIYLLGVFYHVFQGAILFIMLIWIPEAQIEDN